MKLTIDRLSLLKALNIVSVAIGQKSPTPAFSNFKFEMKEDTLFITGSNDVLTICSNVNVEKDGKTIITDFEQGGVLIPSKYLLEIVKKLDSEFITIDLLNDGMIKISGGKSKFKLNSMKIENYPDLDLSAEGIELTFNAEEFKKIITQTAFAASTKEIRPILTALNVKFEDGTMECIATDSYRLSKKLVKKELEKNFEINIPVKTLNEVAKMIEDSEVRLFVADRKVVFEFDNTTLYSRLINGDFPKISRMIPDNYPYVLQVNANEFISAISRASLLAIERENIVKLSVSKDELDVSSQSKQIGSANEKILEYKYEGDKFEISFNVTYVIDAIKALQSDNVILSFAGELSAFRITAPNDESIIQIVTPIRSYY